MVFGLVISWHDLPHLTEPAAHHKRAAVVFGLVIFCNTLAGECGVEILEGDGAMKRPEGWKGLQAVRRPARARSPLLVERVAFSQIPQAMDSSEGW